MAILLSFFIAVAAALLYPTAMSELPAADSRIWFLLFINAINLVDGLDGLSIMGFGKAHISALTLIPLVVR